MFFNNWISDGEKIQSSEIQVIRDRYRRWKQAGGCDGNILGGYVGWGNGLDWVHIANLGSLSVYYDSFLQTLRVKGGSLHSYVYSMDQFRGS